MKKSNDLRTNGETNNIVVVVCLFVFIFYFKKEEKAISRFLTAAFHKACLQASGYHFEQSFTTFFSFFFFSDGVLSFCVKRSIFHH